MSSDSPNRSNGNTSIALILASPLHRGATIAMFLSGLGVSAAAPQIALFLVKVLGAPLPVAGLYYLTNLTAPLAGYLIGARSDRTGNRLGLFRLCAVAGFVGWTGIASSTQVWMPFVISAAVLAFSTAAGSQVFAAVHDELKRHPGGANDGVVSVVRMALTAGWVVGPVLGSWIASQLGLRWMLFITGLSLLAQVVPLGTIRLKSPAELSEPERSPKVLRSNRSLRTMFSLLAFTGLYVMVYAGESVKYGYLPIYMIQRLGLPPAVGGAVIGIQPFVELLIMPFSLIIGRRVGLMQIMAFGAGLGVAANLFFATSHTAAGMFAGQICMGGVWGIFAALGIIAAQRLLPTAVATASALFMSAPAIGSAIGGLIGSLGVATLGLPHVFFLPGGFAFLAVIGLTLMARARVLDREPSPRAHASDFS